MIREMFKKFKEIKYCTYLYLFLFLFFTNETFAKDNLDKEFDKFKNTIKKYQKKLKDLPKGDSKESIIIDKSSQTAPQLSILGVSQAVVAIIYSDMASVLKYRIFRPGVFLKT